MLTTYESLIAKLDIILPDDEPQQIVCSTDFDGSPWSPGFGVWETDDFGLDSEEEAGKDERLFVNRIIVDRMFHYIKSLEKALEIRGESKNV
jgi:hypothetical protein